MTISERGLTSTQWTEYSGDTKRVQYSTVPTSSITAETVTVSVVVRSQKDTAGITTTSTRPLALQKDGTWYTYGWDLTKNICEVYSSSGYIRSSYTYSPYGQVSASGAIEQSIQWSSEFNDTELGLVYYNYRHYNPVDGRWAVRDRLGEAEFHLYWLLKNLPSALFDVLGDKLRKGNFRDDVSYLERYQSVKYDENGNRILAETEALWPHLGTCEGCKLVLQSKASIAINIHLYSTYRYTNWKDKEGKNVVQHEQEHAKLYISFWNAFVDKANTYEKKYSSPAKCKKQLEILNYNLEKVIAYANMIQKERDKTLYPSK